MSIHTKPSVTGFIATQPKRSSTQEGKTKFYARFGQSHAQRNEDGTFTELEPTYSNLVAYGPTAEWALERLQKGDSFIAQGYQRSYTYQSDGQATDGEEFVATKLGHDLARTRYDVDRTPPAGRAQQPHIQTEGSTGLAQGSREPARADVPALS